MAAHKQRGGSQIGWVSATWPLAGIEVSLGKLTVSSMGNYEFAPSEVTAVEEVGSIPLFSTGIRIHHCKAKYPERVVFYPLIGRDYLLAQIRRAGFAVGTPTTRVRRGFPMRIPAILVVVLLWNGLLLLDRSGPDANTSASGPYTLIAFAGLFALATLLPKSERLQEVFMRDEHDIGEISSLLSLIQLVAGLLLLVSGFSYFTQ